MEERKLYRKIKKRRTETRNKTLIETTYYGLCYGIPPEETYTITKWDDLIEELGFINDFQGYKTRKGKLYVDLGMHMVDIKIDVKEGRMVDKLFPERVFLEDFDSTEITYEYRIVNNKDVRLKQLIAELNMDELIQYFKDNEITYLPNLK